MKPTKFQQNSMLFLCVCVYLFFSLLQNIYMKRDTRFSWEQNAPTIIIIIIIINSWASYLAQVEVEVEVEDDFVPSRI